MPPPFDKRGAPGGGRVERRTGAARARGVGGARLLHAAPGPATSRSTTARRRVPGPPPAAAMHGTTLWLVQGCPPSALRGGAAAWGHWQPRSRRGGVLGPRRAHRCGTACVNPQQVPPPLKSAPPPTTRSGRLPSLARLPVTGGVRLQGAVTRRDRSR